MPLAFPWATFLKPENSIAVNYRLLFCDYIFAGFQPGNNEVLYRLLTYKIIDIFIAL